MKDVTHSNQQVGKNQRGSIAAQHDLAPTGEGVVAHPALGGGKFFRKRESAKMLARRFFSCPSRPAPHRNQDPIAGNIRAVGRDNRRPAQQRCDARSDNGGITLPVTRCTRLFVQGNYGSDGSCIESVVALDGRVSVVKVQIISGGRTGRNGMNGIDVGVDEIGGLVATILLGIFSLGMARIAVLTPGNAVLIAPSKQRCLFRYGLAISSGSWCRISRVDGVAIPCRRREVTLQIRIHCFKLNE